MKRGFVQFAIVPAVEHRRIFETIYSVTPAAVADLAQYRTAVGTAYRAPRMRNAEDTFWPRLHNQFTTLADRTIFDYETFGVAFGCCQAAQIKTDIG